MKNLNFLMLFVILISCQNSKPEIIGVSTFDSKNNFYVISYKNNSNKNYFILRKNPTIIGKDKWDYEIKLVKFIGFKNTKIHDCLTLVSQISATLNGMGLGMEQDLKFYFSLPNDIEKRNSFILLPANSQSLLFYKVEGVKAGKKLKIYSNHFSINDFGSKKKREMIKYFYKMSQIGGYEPYQKEVKNDTLKIVY